MFANFQNKHTAAWLLALCILPFTQAAVACRLATEPLALGAYDVFSPYDLDSVTTFIVTCPEASSGKPQNLSISIGVSATSGSIMDRKMRKTGGTDTLSYNLFLDATRTSIWGNNQGLDTLTEMPISPGVGRIENRVSIFGRIPAGQDVSAGQYSDNVTVTIMP